MNLSKTFPIFLLIFLSYCYSTAQTPPNLPAEKISKIEIAITSFMARQNVPGVSIAIVEDNQIRFQRGYGMADVENFVPAKASTVRRARNKLRLRLVRRYARRQTARRRLGLARRVQPGFTSDLWILPRKRFALVILTNLEGGGRLGLGLLANQIYEAVISQ